MLVPSNIPFSPSSFNRGDSKTVLDLLPAASQAKEDLFTRIGTCTIWNLKGALTASHFKNRISEKSQ